jgi:hypothetical protein
MNETEIRDRIRAAMPAPTYPPDLTRRVVSQLGQPRRAAGAPRLVSLVAALLALAIVATLVFIRLESGSTIYVPAGPAPNKPPAPAVIGVSQLDLDRTQLSAELVTPLNISSTSNGRTVTLIGAYADTARTVLFFRAMPAPAFRHVSVYDQTGLLNAAGASGPGSIGDFYWVVQTGPRAGPDGIAHLRAALDVADAPPAKLAGAWTFTFAVSVGAFTHLDLQPPLTNVGTWRFTVETMEVTPAVIHFETVIAGAAVRDVTQDTVTLTDPTGGPAPQARLETSATADGSARLNVTWPRPAVTTTYVLTIVGGGGRYEGAVAVPGPGSPITKGVPLQPTDYPQARESLKIEGAFSTTITTARPNACGAGGGPSGEVFAFGAWFQVDGAWYDLYIQTDPRVRQYTGPGTYEVRAGISPLGAGAIFEGPVELTVTSDQRPGPQTGTVQGVLAWTGSGSATYSVDVSGSWTCTFSTQLGPG